MKCNKWRCGVTNERWVGECSSLLEQDRIKGFEEILLDSAKVTVDYEDAGTLPRNTF